MNHYYLKIDDTRRGTIVYLRANILKEFKYFSRGIEYCDYNIKIECIDTYEYYEDTDFEEKYGGIFICFDDLNNIKLYDNVKQEFIDLENYEDCKNIFYMYNNESKYYSSIHNVLKEILYDIFILPQIE